MVDFNFNPKYHFSLIDWSYGYIFQQLYQISKHEYGNSFYFINNNELWFVSTKFALTNKKTKEDTLHFTMEFYTHSNGKELILIEDPPVHIVAKAKDLIIRYLGAGDDYTDFYKFTQEFEELTSLPDALPGYRLSSVLMQEWMPILGFLSTNTTVEMYHTFLMNFLHHWGIGVRLGRAIIPSFPPLENLKLLVDDDYRKTKIGYRSKYMQAMITAILTKKLPLDELEAYSETIDKKKLLKKMQETKGIGDYTARCILLYGLKDYSVGFVDSFIKTIMHEYFKTDKKIANKDLMNKIDDLFYPYQGLMIDWLTAIYSKTMNINKDKYFILRM